jgi:exopolyphosphatase
MLEKMGLWRKSDAESVSTSEEEMAKLALAPILIDTTNLTNKDKVTKFDTSAYDFLLPKATTSNSSWDSSRFYSEIQKTKENSLDLLTVDEILDRDYKEWAEKPSRHTDQPPIQIGICSMVKSIPWVVRKAGSSSAFLDSLKQFASQRNLDIVIVMTAFSSADGDFSRELHAYTLNDRGIAALKAFISESSSQLGLEDWFSLDGEDHSQDIKSTLQDSKDGSLWTRLWVQTNVSKSRKQVAPLIRGAAASL